MIGLVRTVVGWITGGALDRVLNTVDRKIAAESDRERIKADVVMEYYRSRAGWMQAGGFWLLAAFGGVVLFHFGAVAIYSVFWCADCAWPQPWTIAALPAPMDEWEGWIVLACIGGAGAFAWKR
ncbi:MAG: hypothetical protein GYB53_19855 [Rhodobacteraceae bacterium]|nr:hypothetical protein [Paracoccaceae bacterium]MBR9823959.1 hypothetical protein [Paracoccaceae bacterium]